MTDSKMAYGVYYYDTSVNPAVGHGMEGNISDDGNNVAVTPNLNENLNGAPTVHSFTDTDNNPMLAVTDYEDGANRNVYIKDYSGTLLYTLTWEHVENLYSLVRIGDYLYALDYDNARVVEIYATDDEEPIYTETGRTCPFSVSGYNCFGMALAVVNNTLYGLFSVTDSTWADYQNSHVVKFDIPNDTSEDITITANNSNFEKNAFTLVEQSGYFYVCAIGGRQYNTGYNTNTKLQCAAVIGFSSTSIVSTVMSGNASLPYEFRDITFNGSTAYILTGAYNSSWNLAGKLISVTMTGSSYANEQTVVDFSNGVFGYYWSVLYTGDNSRLWFAKGNEIDIVDTTISLGISSLQNSQSLYTYTNLNDMCYIGTDPSALIAKLRGYRSPLQVSRTKVAADLKSITAGRPEATPEELEEVKMV